MQSDAQRTIQPIAAKIKAKEPQRMPVIIAPSTLVALKVTTKRISEVAIANNAPITTNGYAGHSQSLRHLTLADKMSKTIRVPAAMPKATHDNTVGIVITAVYLNIATTMPTIKPAVMAKTEQSKRVLHLQLLKIFTSSIFYDKYRKVLN